MKEGVSITHFRIPALKELKNSLISSGRYRFVDLNHTFHQFALDELSKELFVFFTPQGLYRYSSASSEYHERIRWIVEGLESIQQIKDDIGIHGKGYEHDNRLKALLEGLQSYNITLRRESGFGTNNQIGSERK